MKLKKLATMILSGCLAVTALGTLSASATTTELVPGYGSITYGYENRYIGISQKRWFSQATGEMAIYSCTVKQTNGQTYSCEKKSSFTTPWVPSNMFKSATIKFAHKMRNPNGTYTYHAFITKNC